MSDFAVLKAITTFTPEQSALDARDLKISECIEHMGKLYVLHPSNSVVRLPRYPLLIVWLAGRIEEIGAG